MGSKVRQKISNRSIMLSTGSKKSGRADGGQALLIPRVAEETSLAPLRGDRRERFSRSPASKSKFFEGSARGQVEGKRLGIMSCRVNYCAMHVFRPSCVVDDVFNCNREGRF